MNDEFWEDMREERFMLVDAPARKVAIYPNDSGMVIVAIKEGRTTCVTTLQVSEIDATVSALIKAKQVAQPMDELIDAQYGAHCAIEKAKGKTE